MKTNGKETCPFTNLTLPDGSPLRRISYRAMATGYKSVDGSGGYAFQYPALKTVNLHHIPGTERTYLCKLAVEQSFMEMMYRIRREYEVYGEDSFFCWEVALALANTANVDIEKQKIAALDIELNATAETLKRASAGKTQAELEKIVNGADTREHYRTFMNKLKALPTVNSMGKPIIVNGLDCQGTLLVNADGNINEQRLAGVRRKTFCITPERVDLAPELLTFDNELYRTFIKSGIVQGDEIEYETTFGIKLRISGNTRTLKQFLGFKRVKDDKTVEFITATTRSAAVV